MAQEEAMDIIARLLDRYMAVKDNKNSERLSQEIDNIEIENSEAQNRAQKVYDEVREAVTYDKFVRNLSQKPKVSDVAKDGDHDRNGSSLPAEKSLHQPEYWATVKSHASESYLFDTEVQSALMNQPSSGMRNPEVRLSVSDNGQRIHPVDSEMIGQDLWKQLKRVTIPVFFWRHIKIGKQPLWPALIKHQPQLSISYYSYVNVQPQYSQVVIELSSSVE